MRIRNREILFASIFCYFIFKIKLYRHHNISLLIILICIILLYILEIFQQISLRYYENKIFKFIILQGLKVIINICRVFSDLIEKYLFDFNFIDPFKILFVKGIVQTLLIICFYLFNINDSK